MRFKGFAAAALAVLYLASPALAWNATGHRIIAAIAYDHLKPKIRAKVDELIKHHPDYATILTKDAPADPAARVRFAFTVAATWPDILRGDNRFYDESRKDAVPTPVLPGFPEMARHTNWHYINIPVTFDGTHGEVEPDPTALSELTRILGQIGRPIADPANPTYDLPWLEHLVGDVHQPLHTTSKFSKDLPMGDAGGNREFLGAGAPGKTLHAIWDDAAGTDNSDAYVNKFAVEAYADYVNAHGKGKRLSKDPNKWIAEGTKIAVKDVYTFGPDNGTRDHPVPIPAGYEATAAKIARERVVMAGLRLAAVLNEKLK